MPHILGLVSDTHGILNSHLFTLFANVQGILHAGDIDNQDVLSGLEYLAPVQAVQGNCDARILSHLPITRRLTIHGVRILMLHNVAGLDRALLQGPEDQEEAVGVDDNAPHLVLFGHSHRPHLERCESGPILVNPGSAGPRRFHLPASAGLLYLAPPTVTVRIVSLEASPWDVLFEEQFVL